jgi:hypothetical protein
MTRSYFSAWLNAWALCLLLLGADAFAGEPAARSLAPVRLRGYGEVSATFTVSEKAPGGTFSCLTIACESAEKAGIVHAKYVSDLHLLGEVKDETLAVVGITVPVFTVPRQGVVSAFRHGKTVYIAASPKLEVLRDGLVAVKGKLAGAELVPSSQVPMYLDAWDKHGFRFYYWPFQQPKGVEWKNYDLLAEFDFAKLCNESGVVIWSGDDRCDFADGLTNEPFWDWAARAASRRNLPVVVNSQLTDNAAWLLNRYRDQTQKRMPGYCGGYYTAGDASHAGLGHISWSATTFLDAEMAVQQQTWRKYAKLDTTIEYLEPHGELRHGEHDILTEYGPEADRSYRDFLKQQHGSLTRLSQRWHGDARVLKSWDDVRVPELVHFLGFDAKAMDLGGDWKIRLEESSDGKSATTNTAPLEWYQPGFADNAWPSLTAPHSDMAMFQPRRPAVWRRHFLVTPEWKAQSPRVWLYVFSLNRGKDERSPMYLNGQKVGEPVMGGIRNWTVAEVTGALKAGENLLALRLPQNYLGYRVYLTGRPPAQYPQLGEALNAQWADFIRWQAHTRQESCRRGLEAIREVDPDRSVICMAPDAFIGGLEELCQDYGGHFHNTGSMAGWWSESLPMMARAAGLPNSAEPGGPARTLPEFKFFLGNWLTEGVNAIHYFIHIGDICWNPEIRAWFEEHQPTLAALGKMHIPKAEVAMLFDDDVDNLLGWPWKPGHNGYLIQFNGNLHKEYHLDAVSLRDFGRGFADGYRAVVDTESPVLDEPALAAIEAWVRRGGVFITTGETGRHTPEKADAWPISRLTGYAVSKVTAHPNQQKMKFAPGQAVFSEADWTDSQLNRLGLYLQKVAPECQDLLRWPDGSTAVGLRKLGQGMVVTVGCKYNYSTFLLEQVFAWLKLNPVPGYAPEKQIISTHEVSNNGLYDVWVLFNREREKPGKSRLVFRAGCRPEHCFDLQTRQEVPLVREGAEIRTAELEFGPADIRILLTPCAQICQAPLDWLELQRGWWRGTTAPRTKLPPYRAPNTLALTADWKILPLPEDAPADQSALAAVGLDDRAWEKADLVNWLVPEERPSHRAFFRKAFTVPAGWQDGEIKLWIKSWTHEAVRGRMRVWLDGQKLADGSSVTAYDLTAQLKPRSAHLLAVEIKSEGQVAGCIGNSWLTYLPRPANQVDLAGSWTPSRDGLVWGPEAPLPGPWSDWSMARRRVTVPAAWSGQTAMMDVETETQFGIYGVMVNGRLVRRLHHEVGTVTSLNVTPWIKFGQENELHIVRGTPGKGAIKRVALQFHK